MTDDSEAHAQEYSARVPDYDHMSASMPAQRRVTTPVAPQHPERMACLLYTSDAADE